MLVVRVETDLEKVPKSLWMKDSKSNACNVCKRPILGGWIKSNKHHCRFWYVSCYFNTSNNKNIVQNICIIYIQKTLTQFLTLLKYKR